MASCILPAFSTIAPDFSTAARFDAAVAAADARICDWGSSMYPERFGVVESLAASSYDHAMVDSTTSAAARSSIVVSRSSPCKIEPDCPARPAPPAAAPSDLSHYSPGLPGDHYSLLVRHNGGGAAHKRPLASDPGGAAKKAAAAMDYSECGSLQSVQDTAATTAVGGAAGSPPVYSCSSPSKAGGGGGEPEHEVHIWTERERRKKMRSMFVTLHSMLPKVPSKADKSTIVDEAITYIKQLEQKMQRLLKKKSDKAAAAAAAASSSQQKDVVKASTKVVSDTDIAVTQRGSDSTSFRTLSSSNVVLNLCGSDAFITICARAQPNLLSRVFTCVIQMLKMDVRNVQITDASDNRRLLMIHACATDVTRTSEGDLRNVMQELIGCIHTP